jgi:DNA-binding FadR family transcriptional regulator
VKPIQRISLVDTIVDRLQSEISSGNWPVGKRIPAEGELTKVLGVSRPSLREAVRSIVQLGLLEIRQGDGTYVVASDPSEVALRRMLDEADTSEVLSVRRALDGLAARDAALNRSEAEVAELEAHFEKRSQAIAKEDLEAFVDHDVAFHIGIAVASHNRLLAAIYASFDTSLRLAVGPNNCMSDNTDEILDELHSKLLRAIKERDPEGAEAAALGLLDRSEAMPDERGD